MLTIRYFKKFKKDFKRAKKRGLDISLLEEVVESLARHERLPAKFRDHSLVNCADYQNMRECHLAPDWLLIYQIQSSELILLLVRNGTHSDLFGK